MTHRQLGKQMCSAIHLLINQTPVALDRCRLRSAEQELPEKETFARPSVFLQKQFPSPGHRDLLRSREDGPRLVTFEPAHPGLDDSQDSRQHDEQSYQTLRAPHKPR